MKNYAKMTVEEISRSLSEQTPTVKDIKQLSVDSRVGVRRLAEQYLLRRERDTHERKRLDSMLRYEQAARENGFTYIAGVDEAGRGPLAGPVMAAAVILPQGYILNGLDDSKKLSPQKREDLYQAIVRDAVAWSVGIGEVVEIDHLNIYVASKLAMSRALISLSVQPDFVLVDALTLDNLAVPQQGIVGGDGLSLSIAAASVVAKVTRDRLMCEMDRVFPGYGFAEHKGYPTNQHRRAIAELGPCPMHRKSFALLREAVL